jgi:hypothetical protein
MGRLISLTRDQAICGVALVGLGTLACLSPVHNDTWWHLAYGRDMAARGGFGQFDTFSYTAAGRPFPNHQWLAERLMYVLWALGGLPLLTLACALLLVFGWVLCWHLTRGPLLDRLMITGGAIAASTLVWSVRPQVFTVALLPLVITLLAHQRYWWIPGVVLLWANLHGGVMLGMLAIAVWTAVAVLYDRGNRAARLATTLGLSAAATFCTPVGAGYWPAIFASLKRSQVNRLHEWQPPGWPPEHLFFWGAAAAVVVLSARRWRRLTSTADRALVATAILFLPSATNSLRSISSFMMAAGPAIARLLFTSSVPTDQRQWRSAGVGLLLAGAAAIFLVFTAWSTPWPRLGWVPLERADIQAIRACPGPIYNTYAAGGPIIWFVPSQPVFVDSRQDPYPDGLIAEATGVELGADPGPLFRRFAIKCAVLPVSSPTGPTLEARGWSVRHKSKGWLVLQRPAS